MDRDISMEGHYDDQGEIINQNIQRAGQDTFTNLLHSICQDILERLTLAKNCDQEEVEKAISDCTKMWVKDGIKIRKRPTPRKASAKKEAELILIKDGNGYHYAKTPSLGKNTHAVFGSEQERFIFSYNTVTGVYKQFTDEQRMLLKMAKLPVYE